VTPTRVAVFLRQQLLLLSSTVVDGH